MRNLVKWALLGLLLLTLVLYGCPIYRIFGLLCPACGTTRGWLSFLKGEVGRAFQYNMLFWMMPIYLYLWIHRNMLSRRRAVDVFLVIATICMVGMNVMRWLGLFKMPI